MWTHLPLLELLDDPIGVARLSRRALRRAREYRLVKHQLRQLGAVGERGVARAEEPVRVERAVTLREAERRAAPRRRVPHLMCVCTV